MVFKRYIHKHGKKHGPYYYKNVRSNDGKVKTIYIGSNPSHHPKHKARKPLFFLIVILTFILILGSLLFFLQNKAYLIKKVKQQEPDFDIDNILLKVLVRSNEFIEKQIRVMNVGNALLTINIEVLNLNDIVRIDSSAFTIKPGQTKIVTLNFSSFLAGQNIEQQAGIYVGKLIVRSDKAEKEIPLVVEIETKNVLFDMNLNPLAIERKVKQGSDTSIEVRLFNLQSIESTNVDVEYFVKDINGNTIQTESETVVVKTQASFFKTITIPKKLKPGSYVFAAQARFGNSVGTASYLFEVISQQPESFAQFCKNNALCLGLSLTAILLLFALTAYFYFFIGAYLYEKVSRAFTLQRKKREKEEFEEVAKEIAVKEERPSEILTALKSLKSRIRRKQQNWKKERERKRSEKERLKREKELQRLAEERKAHLRARRKQLEEEKRKQEAIKRQAELRLQKEFELKEKERRILAEERKKQREKEKRLQEEQKIQEALRRQKELKLRQTEQEKLKKISERKNKLKKFLHKIGLHKTLKEKRQIALQKEKERREKIRLKESLKRQKELTKQKAMQKKIRQQELLIKQRAIEAKLREKETKRKQLELEEKRRLEEKLKKKEEQEKKQKELEKQKEVEEKKPKERKARWFEGLFKSEKLDISKEIEEIKEKAIGKSKKFEKFYNCFVEANESIDKEDFETAKKLYIKARRLYIELDYHEKKEAYKELMGLYNKLIK